MGGSAYRKVLLLGGRPLSVDSGKINAINAYVKINEKLTVLWKV
jgi:hypothetical protein